mmetsp:Transcript_26746/g.37650  ORF Transcript_26746/g.37650 Transcript_26746/m.37650 type:complete len:186 (+) Transcript_26746:501-1058(+)
MASPQRYSRGVLVGNWFEDQSIYEKSVKLQTSVRSPESARNRGLFTRELYSRGSDPLSWSSSSKMESSDVKSEPRSPPSAGSKPALKVDLPPIEEITQIPMSPSSGLSSPSSSLSTHRKSKSLPSSPNSDHILKDSTLPVLSSSLSAGRRQVTFAKTWTDMQAQTLHLRPSFHHQTRSVKGKNER